MFRAKTGRRAAAGAVIAGALVLLGFAVYETVEQPTNQIFGRTLTHGPANQRVVALTFDDGPNPPYTDRILDVLEREHVRATFFVVGRAVAAYPGVVRRELRDGDAIGNHTWAHGHLIVMTRSQIRASLQRTDEEIYKAAHVRTRLMRPPFGARDWLVMQAVRSLGYTVVMWDVPLPRDWEDPAPATIAQRVLPYVGDGAIIVLHDGNRGLICGRARAARQPCDRTNDIEATDLIVRALKRRGYRFVTIPQLASLRPHVSRTPHPAGLRAE